MKKKTAIITSLLAVILLATGLRVNIDASIPPGLYLGSWDVPQKGDTVICDIGEVAPVYSGPARIGKVIAAVAGDTVVINQSGVRVNGALWPDSRPLAHDSQGRSLPKIRGRWILENDEYLLMGRHRRSFDSRYFGLVRGEHLTGVIKPLVTTSP